MNSSEVKSYHADALVIGGGLAGIVSALELLDLNKSVILVDAEPETNFGGQANDAFGGMLLINTKEQAKNGIQDSPELLLNDWLRAAEFSADDIWGQRWAKEYAYSCKPDVYDWLHHHGIRFFPAVQWVERGNVGNGNSLPRYHIAWGCGRGVVQTLISKLRAHKHRDKLQICHQHRVHSLVRDAKSGAIQGCIGSISAENSPDKNFKVTAAHTIVCSGGINGNIDRVRQHWDPIYGPFPENILNGVSPAADGALHDEVSRVGGQVVNLGQMWNYAAGIAHPQPKFSRHGLSLIPPRSALWLNAKGERVGPAPMVTGFDTHDLCKRTGNAPGQYTWQVMNWKIATKEMAISGTDENPLFRDKKLLKLIWQTLRGNHNLVRWMVDECEDVVCADNLTELAEKMRALANDDLLDAERMCSDIRSYDANIQRGPSLWNDDQLRKIQQLRQWKSDKLRTCKFQPIEDKKAGPLIAIRERIVSRKSMGGMLTNLDAAVLDKQQQPIPGLFAAGEAAGFGGGGISGIRSLEGTFLANCILNSRRAVQAIARQEETK
ncbi:FAD-binding dehydrogenase [Aliidiomarina iranensis]|uniref:FAD-binding dehydrogenase n=1 Tax=Aliidiomarina iranensis TaxID=1434071 RepID=A0A432VU16_9GAMM|nr:FAD-binding dehydrogenase [Aliidiomarina iranensis]RUO19968.1 FAD-binding dehydrogenase [Aliidiomarina iranensis]